MNAPYAECAEVVMMFELYPRKKEYVQEWINEGMSPAEAQAEFAEVLGSKGLHIFRRQAETPAFLRYLAGLMGAM
jgi:hypothetical protein